jgi:hypothetical protein
MDQGRVGYRDGRDDMCGGEVAVKILTRYWIEFENVDLNVSEYSSHAGLGWGVGVTAHNWDDALSLLQDLLFRGDPIPNITHVIENIDVSNLDDGHILPNIGPPTFRGIWYPNFIS